MLFSHVFAQQNSRLPLSIPTTAATCPSLSRHFSASLSPFKINTYEIPHKCCIQRTYRITNLFRINTYKIHGGRGVLWLTNFLLPARHGGSSNVDLSSQPLTNCPPRNLFLLTSLQMPGGIGDRVQEFLKHYFNCGRMSGGINHLQGAGQEKSLPQLSPLNFQLSTVSSGPSMLPMLSIIRGRSDAHAPKLVAIILLEEHVPLFAALQDFFLLRRNLFADFQLHLLFFLQRGRQDQHHLLPDGVPVVHKFHVVARHQHFRNLVRQSHNLFPAKSHSRSHSLIYCFYLPISSFYFLISSFWFLTYSPYFPISSFCFLVSAL